MSGREHLIVVVPGIGGSVLAEPERLDDQVWRITPGPLADLLVHPDELSIDRDLVPVGLVRSLRLFAVWTPIVGYERLMNALGALPGAVVHQGDPRVRLGGANVVAFPYDFRHSIRDAADRLGDLVNERLEALWPEDLSPSAREGRRPRVVLVAHSMGGLVARYWMAQQQNWRLCRTLITLATPHRGAPKALEVLVNGVPVGPGGVLHATKPVKVLRGWPSVYELLPRYPMIATVDPRSQVLRAVRPHELSGNGLEWLPAEAARAWEVHQAIESGWDAIPRSGPHVVARIGYGHGTLQTASWDGRRLRVTSDPDRTVVGGWADDRGDGTVPAMSGLPLELDNHTGHGLKVAFTHGRIVDLPEVLEIVESIEGRPPLKAMHGEEGNQDDPVLGVDVAEVSVAGAPLGLTARIDGTSEDPGNVPVWASLSQLDDRGRVVAGTTREMRLDRGSGGTWAGELTPAGSGAYRLDVTADAIPAGGAALTQRIIQVVEADEVE